MYIYVDVYIVKWRERVMNSCDPTLDAEVRPSRVIFPGCEPHAPHERDRPTSRQMCFCLPWRLRRVDTASARPHPVRRGVFALSMLYTYMALHIRIQQGFH